MHYLCTNDEHNFTSDYTDTLLSTFDERIIKFGHLSLYCATTFVVMSIRHRDINK